MMDLHLIIFSPVISTYIEFSYKIIAILYQKKYRNTSEYSVTEVNDKKKIADAYILSSSLLSIF